MNHIRTKLALAAAFIAAGLVAYAEPGHRWIVIVLVAFGLLNVFASGAGTASIRALSIAAAFAALFSSYLRMIVLLFAVLVWPTMVLLVWAARSDEAVWGPDEQARRAARDRSRVTLAAIVAAVAIGAAAYRLLVLHSLQQTAMLFVGLPALLAIVVIFGVSPQSTTGATCKAVTVGLLVSMLFLGEGMLCVAMSAPLFFAVAILIADPIDRARRRLGQHLPGSRFSFLMMLAVVPMSLEGVTDGLSFNRDESVSVARVVDASADAVARALFETPRFDRALPYYLRAGFPTPLWTRIGGSEPMRWAIRMRGGEMLITGMEPKAGDLVLELEESRPGRLRWRAVADDSHMTHFLEWRESLVEWRGLDERTTQVTWTLRYRRKLDPAWYFGPWERYAVGLAAGFLIDAVATP